MRHTYPDISSSTFIFQTDARDSRRFLRLHRRINQRNTFPSDLDVVIFGHNNSFSKESRLPKEYGRPGVTVPPLLLFPFVLIKKPSEPTKAEPGRGYKGESV